MDALFSLISPELLAFAFVVTVIAGTVKGAIGFAMPLIMISGLSILIDPKLVVAGIILPIVLTNILQVTKGGLKNAWDALMEYRTYVILVCIMILITSQFVAYVSADMMLLGLGVIVTVLCAIQIAGVRVEIPPHRRKVGSVIAGILSGILGGFSGTWGPTTVLYLVAVDTPKAKQFSVQGVVYGAGAVMLLIGHLKSGILNAQTVPFSLALIPPGVLGMWIGFKIHDRIDQVLFRKATLWVLLIAGINLVRRGIMG
ncbi:hypothetical protein BVC71_06335 [Marivivens niveibacter]|uniref:Probable membrane transporter protein n=1 Tax=Marivivens niveibacter TaxID=1930667 RepID=A0A251WZA0_9RHOB|nr:sulfite exporter TauE/SafE family protein [Marivivens niveibacter]OUD09465.1 hypothetical protein BVC71_06335 [Marivivens niveibacter]